MPVQVIQSGRNGGFGAGNNVGIRAGLPGGARPDYAYILNSDAFPAPDAIRAFLERRGLVAPGEDARPLAAESYSEEAEKLRRDLAVVKVICLVSQP